MPQWWVSGWRVPVGSRTPGIAVIKRFKDTAWEPLGCSILPLCRRDYCPSYVIAANHPCLVAAYPTGCCGSSQRDRWRYSAQISLWYRSLPLAVRWTSEVFWHYRFHRLIIKRQAGRLRSALTAGSRPAAWAASTRWRPCPRIMPACCNRSRRWCRTSDRDRRSPCRPPPDPDNLFLRVPSLPHLEPPLSSVLLCHTLIWSGVFCGGRVLPYPGYQA